MSCRKCTRRSSTPTQPTSSSTSSRGSTTPSSCQRSMAKRWPTPVAWTRTLSPTTRNTVSSSDGTSSSISQHYTCSLQQEAPDRIIRKNSHKLLTTRVGLWSLSLGMRRSTFYSWSQTYFSAKVCQDNKEALVKGLNWCTLLSPWKQTPHPSSFPHVNNPRHNIHVTYTCILTHLWMYASMAKSWSDVALLLCIYHLWCWNEKTNFYTWSYHVIWKMKNNEATEWSPGVKKRPMIGYRLSFKCQV